MPCGFSLPLPRVSTCPDAVTFASDDEHRSVGIRALPGPCGVGPRGSCPIESDLGTCKSETLSTRRLVLVLLLLTRTGCSVPDAESATPQPDGGPGGVGGEAGDDASDGDASDGDASLTDGCDDACNEEADTAAPDAPSCALPNAIGTYVDDAGCIIISCADGYADCDNLDGNGCEIDTRSDASHCGSCGNTCAFANATGICDNSECALGLCSNGWADCDADAATGCETELASSGKNCGVCGHDCFGGACIAAKCAPVALASGQGTPWSIALSTTHVYWTVRGYPGYVRRVPRDGGLTQTLASGQGDPDGLALNATHVVWANADDTIRTVPVNGGSVATLATVAGAHPVGVAVKGSYVFWTNWGAGTIQRVGLSGGTPVELSSGENLPHRIVSDGTNVWWTSIGNDAVRRADIDGSNVTTVADGQVDSLGVAIDETHVYWSNQGDKAISRASFTTGSITVLASAPNIPAGIAVDDTHVYFTDGHPTGAVRRVPKAGGSIETLGADQDSPLYVAVDGDSVFWTNREGGTIMRLAK